MKLADFNFHPELQEGIDASRYITATPVQEQVIPHILSQKDVIASAQTGTGKTAAFLLPVINSLLTTPHAPNEIACMIIVPTRELAIQIGGHIEGLCYFTNISSIAIYGGNDGNSFVQEKKALSSGVDIVVCTPGKIISHINMGYAKVKNLRFLILDEADRMLDMGFYDDIMRIINQLPTNRQTLLFSATMPPKIRQLSSRILKNPAEINIAISRPPDAITQQKFVVFEEQKIPLTLYLLTKTNFKSIIIFCSKKTQAKQLTAALKQKRQNAAEIHSDLQQAEREETLRGFTSKRIPILVATDILSRGIDIDHIDLVINFDVPADGEDYVHRIGRTARAESKGTAYTFVLPKEQRKFRQIEQLIGKEVPLGVLPAEIGPAPEIFTDSHRPPRNNNNNKTQAKKRKFNPNYRKPRGPQAS